MKNKLVINELFACKQVNDYLDDLTNKHNLHNIDKFNNSSKRLQDTIKFMRARLISRIPNYFHFLIDASTYRNNNKLLLYL